MTLCALSSASRSLLVGKVHWEGIVGVPRMG